MFQLFLEVLVMLSMATPLMTSKSNSGEIDPRRSFGGIVDSSKFEMRAVSGLITVAGVTGSSDGSF